MLQQDEPSDYVIATGEEHSVRSSSSSPSSASGSTPRSTSSSRPALPAAGRGRPPRRRRVEGAARARVGAADELPRAGRADGRRRPRAGRERARVGEGLGRPASSLSVVVVAYHSGPGLARCLESLRREAPEAEVVVVDNGGADGDVGDERRDGLRVVVPDENLGFAAGANRGAAESSGDVLGVPQPGHRRRARRACRRSRGRWRTREIGIAMARLRLLDRPELLNSGGTVVHVSGLAWAGRFGEPADEHLGDSRTSPRRAAQRWRSAARRFDALGGFTGELFMYHEDVELSWRAHLHGLRVVVDPGADVFHEYEFGRQPDQDRAARAQPADLRAHRVLRCGSCSCSAPCSCSESWRCSSLAARRRWFRGKLGGWWWLMRHPRWLAPPSARDPAPAEGPGPRARAPSRADARPEDDVSPERDRFPEPPSRPLLVVGAESALMGLLVVLINHEGAVCRQPPNSPTTRV